MPDLLHLVARTAAGARPFDDRRACAALWSRITRNFDVVALALMPDHVHLLAQIEQDVALRAFSHVLSAFRTKMRATAIPHLEFDWERIPAPEKVQRDRRHIARTLRYIHLNPTRDALCKDPLEWEWSTHRDWLGAVARPCVDRARWSRAMGRRFPSSIGWVHEYVSSDPSVPDKHPPASPNAYLHSVIKDASIDQLVRAVPQALRSRCRQTHEFGAAERRLFLLAAARWTSYSGATLARHLGCHPTSAQRAIQRQRAQKRTEGDGVRVPGEHEETGATHASEEQASRGVPSHDASTAGGRGGASRQRRHDLLTHDELHAMAMILADRRLDGER